MLKIFVYLNLWVASGDAANFCLHPSFSHYRCFACDTMFDSYNVTLQQEVRVQMQNATTDISPFNQAFPVVSWEAFKGNQTVLPHSNSRAVPSQGMKVSSC